MKRSNKAVFTVEIWCGARTEGRVCVTPRSGNKLLKVGDARYSDGEFARALCLLVKQWLSEQVQQNLKAY